VADARNEQRVEHGAGERIALAGDERRGDRTGIAGIAARMRRSMPSRTFSTAMAKPSRQPGGAGAATEVIAPSARPVAPMPWK
jgi:hypothetical protein